MAKHESEMHRQRRIALEALQAICHLPGLHGTPLSVAKHIAQTAINDICGRYDQGLFADHRQMDLADRKDC